MKDKMRNIAVFIASPGDLSVERQQFRDAIKSLNEGFGDGRDVAFESLGWEDALSSAGRRSQGVINIEIDRCDVFILALNRRWGQEAEDSEFSSYTEEEFHRALMNFKSKGTPEIFIFFKRVDPESEADPGPQLKRVMEFRKSLESTKQFLYRYFDGPESFGSEIDKHLRCYAKGDLPSLELASEATVLPQSAIEEIKRAKQEAVAAREVAELEATRSLELALQAADAALNGKVEEARQKFAMAITGTTNRYVLSLASEFYYRTDDFNSAQSLADRWTVEITPELRILQAWRTNELFLDNNYKPIALPYGSEFSGGKSFEMLVRLHGGGLLPAEVVDTLIVEGRVSRNIDSDVIEIINTENLPPVNSVLLDIGSQSMRDFASTIDCNLRHSDTPRRMQIATAWPLLPQNIDVFKKYIHVHAMEFIRETNSQLEQLSNKTEITSDSPDNPRRVGIGVYYFENESIEEPD